MAQIRDSTDEGELFAAEFFLHDVFGSPQVCACCKAAYEAVVALPDSEVYAAVYHEFYRRDRQRTVQRIPLKRLDTLFAVSRETDSPLRVMILGELCTYGKSRIK